MGDKLQKEIINSIPDFRNNVLVQKAIENVEKQLEKRQLAVDKSRKVSKDVEETKQQTKSQMRREAMCI